MAIGPLGNVAPPKLKFFIPGTSTPAAGAKLFTYAGGTTTKQATYSNDAQTLNTNPIILDANGECVVFVDSTLKYDFTFAPSTDTDPPTNPYWTVQNMGYQEMIASFAPLASPAFTGTPTAPTPALGDSSSTLATTQFVQQTVTNSTGNTALTGTPTAPTASAGTYTTQIATTAFVGAEITRALNAQSYTASSTFTVPTNVTKLRVKLWGGGGGGGGASSASAGAGGGGGGGYVEAVVTVTSGQSIPFTIGTGGAGGTGSGNGTAGGASSIASLSLTANGGTGGTGSASGGTTSAGTGGTATGGFLNIAGGGGSFGNSFSSIGYGGFGGGAYSSSVSTGTGVSPGGGGGGGGDAKNGSSGANGMVVFEWLAP